MRGQERGVTVIDDYGHHPTEIRATLAAARLCNYKRIHVIFQPHRYTRTQALMDEFAKSFHQADAVYLLDIYAASEKPIEGVTSEALAERMREFGHRSVEYCGSIDQAVAAVRESGSRRRTGDDPGRGQRLASGRQAASGTLEGGGLMATRPSKPAPRPARNRSFVPVLRYLGSITLTTLADHRRRLRLAATGALPDPRPALHARAPGGLRRGRARICISRASAMPQGPGAAGVPA